MVIDKKIVVSFSVPGSFVDWANGVAERQNCSRSRVFSECIKRVMDETDRPSLPGVLDRPAIDADKPQQPDFLDASFQLSALAVKCDRCRSSLGLPCVTPFGNPKTDFHAVRISEAKIMTGKLKSAVSFTMLTDNQSRARRDP